MEKANFIPPIFIYLYPIFSAGREKAEQKKGGRTIKGLIVVYTCIYSFIGIVCYNLIGPAQIADENVVQIERFRCMFVTLTATNDHAVLILLCQE